MARTSKLPPGFTLLASGQIRWRVQVGGHRLTGTADTITAAKRDRAQAQIERGGNPTAASVPVLEVIDHYFEGATIAPATRQRDTYSVKHLPDVFLARTASEIQPVHVAALWRQMQADGAPGWAIHRAGVVLSKSWKAGAAMGWVSSNPFRVVTAPRPAPADEVTPPSIDEVRDLIDGCRTEPMALIMRLAAVTGARRGELVALQWNDIRLADAELIVHRSLAEVDGTLYEGDTKTGRKGHRVIPLDPATVKQLRKHHRQRVVGCPWVFTHDGLTPWRPPYVTREFDRIRARTPGITCSYHGLRHFAATQWLGAGHAPSQVAGFLGHSTVATVLRTYAHFIPAQGRDIITAHAAALDG